ncbi:MAG: rnpA [Rickettsiaceae bacterium]|jgi:ribonuclease P protein component|nr:rnpA [Rickettsiaceae bacterium]
MHPISIKKRADFTALSKSTIRFHSKTSLVLAGKTNSKYLINPHTKKIDDFCRFGLTVSKKVGIAVVRNKIKRRYRDIFLRLYKENLTESYFDYVIIAKTEAANCDFEKIYDDLKFCLKHIKRLIKENERAAEKTAKL